MKTWRSALISLLLPLLLALPVPAAALTSYTVQHGGSGTPIFSTIQAAVDEVHRQRVAGSTDSFEIRVAASTDPYSGPVTIQDPVSIIGENTGSTFISGGTSPLITVSGSSGVVIRNFTFRVTGTAIAVTGDAVATISNNVFQMGTSNTAIVVTGSPSASIVNNTFYQNKIAISTDSNLVISNNIFSTNTTAISTTATLTKLSFNDYHPSANSGVSDLGDSPIPNSNQSQTDPLFVNPDASDFTQKDFHLQAGSPCIGTGNPSFNNPGSTVSDRGAYGGPNSNGTPPQVTGVTTSILSDGTSIQVTWDASTSTSVTAYRVYFTTSDGSNSGLQSPQQAEGRNNTSITLAGFPLGPSTPSGTPTVALTAQNQALLVSWTQVNGASGYRVDYQSTSPISTGSVTVNGGSTLSTTLSGLTNNVTYSVTVTPLAETKVTVYVTAVFDTSVGAQPGSANESSASESKTVQFGGTVTGTTSAAASDFPESSSASPNLKGEGCFIATATYGFYSAPQVQALRDFRDRFLMTNDAGRAFVAWYYHYGPRAAHFINLHPWLKAPVRVLLLPLVVLALIATAASAWAKGSLILLLALGGLLWLRRTRLVRHAPALGKLLLVLSLLVLPALAQAAEPARPDRPHWSLELKGGGNLASNGNFFGGGFLPEYGAAFAYKVHRMVEVGVEATYLRSSGNGRQVQHNATSDAQVTYERLPLDVFVLGRLVFNEDQLLVPYAGVGYTRLFYQDHVAGNDSTKVSVNGYHARGGLQILMDGLERDASSSLYREFGIHHTYLFAEGKYTDARAQTTDGGKVNLGGTSILGGLLFEF